MGRRQGGGDKLFNKEKEKKKQADFKRQVERKTQLETIIIACEGTKTEPLYFKKIFSDLICNYKIAKSSFVIAKHGHTNPCGVLDDLLQHRENGYQYSDYDHQWIVIDRDEQRVNGGGHTLQDFNEAIAKAKRNKILVAYSNPCFEIWFLLHIKYRDTAISRDDVLKELEESIGYTKNSDDIYEILIEQQGFAIDNAARLMESHQQGKDLNPANDNPSTSVYKLVNLLNGLKKQG